MIFGKSSGMFLNMIQAMYGTAENFRARIQGFADHSEEKKAGRKSSEIVGSLKIYSR
jgi:hypothetical protein